MNQPIIVVNGQPAEESKNSIPVEVPVWKRILDVGLILVAAPFFLPVMVVVGLTVVIVSPGPIFYSQERIGLRGRRFRCWKFRSMKTGACAGSHKVHTLRLMQGSEPWAKMDGADPRVIPLGNLIRATGMDETPQLLNVLLGDMSIVGPRPCTQYEFENYTEYQRRRLEGLPGLTGLWQVSGKGKTTFSEMVDLDIRYLESMSLGHDLKIMFLTVPALLKQCWESVRVRLANSAGNDVESDSPTDRQESLKRVV